MKLNLTSQRTIASDGLKMTKMGVDDKSIDLIVSYLRDKIYKDKILAPIREYICNATDSMIEAENTNDSVLISLKSLDNSWIWSVRDFGYGLNEHDIRNVFGSYGTSSKRETNTLIGSYGIGAGSAFAYGDSFYVTSYHQGTKTSYVCSLGRGENGVSIGEIYKVSEEPTSEQGIEVSLDVKYSDLSTFSKKTENFVKFFSPNVKVNFNNHYNKEAYNPTQPLDSKTVDGFVFNAYTDSPEDFYSTTTYFIRMGGVVYPHTHSNRKSRPFTNNVIVDVPIGMLSIPISRESIESTPLNDKVFEKIEDALDKIITEEVAGLTPPKFGNMVTGNGGSYTANYSTGWFNHNFKTCFPVSYKTAIHVHKGYNTPDHYNSNVCKGATKYIIYVMPNIESIKNWQKRLIHALQTLQGDDYDGYVYIKKNHYETMLAELDSSIDTSDCTFVDIKSLKLPKLDKKVSNDKEQYVTFNQYGNKKYYTAQELDDLVRQQSFDDNELEDDWYLEVETLELLKKRVIGDSKKFGTRYSCWTANSKKMIENLKELGWLTPDCKEYKDMVSKFDEVYRVERLMQNATYNLEKLYYGGKVNDRLKNIIKKNPEKLQKLDAVKTKIRLEQTTRGRILQSISEYDRKLTRQDLRKILMLKD
jgi:hypothetical protein